MANEESRDFSGSQQIDQATDQGTVAITGATESTNGINANVQLGPEQYSNGPVGETVTAQAGPECTQSQPAPRQISQAEFRELRRSYFTVRHDTVQPCGHKLDRINQPKLNCEFCWFGFYESHPDLVATADRAYQEQGVRFLDKIRGVRFRKMFCRYMCTKLKLQAEMKAREDEQGREVERDQNVKQDIRQTV